jgi:predicted lipoprotein with Yx(FWY)xxD motif
MRPRLLPLLALSVVAVLLVGADLAVSSGTARPTLSVRSSQYGPVVFDGGNRALYAFTRDQRGRSACYGACATAWPPYIVRGKLTPGAGTSRSLFGTTRRRDGTRQLTYAGRPLYYYVHDPVGQVLCQNVREFGGLWLVIRGSGTLVRAPH